MSPATRCAAASTRSHTAYIVHIVLYYSRKFLLNEYRYSTVLYYDVLSGCVRVSAGTGNPGTNPAGSLFRTQSYNHLSYVYVVDYLTQQCV